MANTSTSTKNVKEPTKAVTFDTPKVPVSGKSVISELWKRASENMNHDEIKWFSGAGEQANVMIFNLKQVTEGIAGLVGADERAGNFEDRQELATLLWFIGDALGTIEAMMDISAEAEYTLHKTNKGGVA